MPKSAKIERTQKIFLKAMKKKFAVDDPTASTIPTQKQFQECPFCNGRGYHKRAFCHQCGGTGKRRIR